ncbi:MAG TPA: hypothetical protein VFN67_27025 [Polyangiales bacterium]|nr:hypothetical protein [Polyangiales bacterium]
MMELTTMRLAIDARERELQHHFENWREGEHLRAGCPEWLSSMEVRPVHFKDGGRNFRPDIGSSSKGKRLVIELKHGRKFEPLALAEVLHHAECLDYKKLWPSDNVHGRTKRGSSSPVIPVIVCQHSKWIRESLKWLVRNGLPPDAIRHVEIVLLRSPNSAEPAFIWFDDRSRSSRWMSTSRAVVPAVLRRLVSEVGSAQSFAKKRGVDVFAFADKARKFEPDNYDGPQTHCARVGKTEQWLVWRGSNDSKGTYELIQEANHRIMRVARAKKALPANSNARRQNRSA